MSNNQGTANADANHRNQRLAGRTAIVTGAGWGIGKAFATRLAEDGANIVIVDIKNQDSAAAEIAASTGARTLALRVDVSVQADTERMAAETLQAFGSIDVLVNNAAMFSTLTMRPFEEIPVEEWRRLMDINIMGVGLCCRAVSAQMRKQQRGRIINLASGAPLKGVPLFLHYIASKGAVIAMTRGLARELGRDGITVNAIAPGFTLSEGVLSTSNHVEVGREMAIRSRAIPRDETPQDVVGAVSFLASDDAAFMTGQTMVVDGGSAMV
jgi:NAD(P)-dependent dehydrogenase (short-subunit alcohol dehydrogenase family)